MNDLIERLRNRVVYGETVDGILSPLGPDALCAEAADALAAERAVRQKLTALLDEKMGTPCEQIRKAQEIDHSERMGDRDTLSWLLAPFFCGNRMPHMSGDMRNRLSPMQRRNLDEAVQAIIASGFAQIGSEMDYISAENRTEPNRGNATSVEISPSAEKISILKQGL